MNRRISARPIILTTIGATALGLTACAVTNSPSEGDVKAATAVTLQDYYTSEPQKSAMEEVYATCSEELGIDISATHIANVALVPKVLQQISSKSLPDVLMLEGTGTQQIAQSGVLAPLTDFGIDGAGIPEGILDVGTYEGKLYGLAPVVNDTALFYNIDMLAEAGIEPPRTWDELEEAAKQLTQDGRYGFAFSAFANEGGASQFLPFMWSNGGELDDITSAESVQALTFLTDLVESGVASKSVVTWKQADVASQFGAGNAAMMVNGVWSIPGLKETGVNWGTVPIPTRLESQKSQVPLGGEAFTVPLTGDEAGMAAAGEVVKCITSPESQLALGMEQINLPSITKVAEQVAEAQPELASFVDALPDARSRTESLGPDYPKVSTQIQTAMQLAITGKATPEEALKEASEQ